MHCVCLRHCTYVWQTTSLHFCMVDYVAALRHCILQERLEMFYVSVLKDECIFKGNYHSHYMLKFYDCYTKQLSAVYFSRHILQEVQQFPKITGTPSYKWTSDSWMLTSAFHAFNNFTGDFLSGCAICHASKLFSNFKDLSKPLIKVRSCAFGFFF